MDRIHFGLFISVCLWSQHLFSLSKKMDEIESKRNINRKHHRIDENQIWFCLHWYGGWKNWMLHVHFAQLLLLCNAVHGVCCQWESVVFFSAAIDSLSILTLHKSLVSPDFSIRLRTRFGAIDCFLIDCYCCPYANVFTIRHTHVFHCRSIFGAIQCTGLCLSLRVCVSVVWIANTKTIREQEKQSSRERKD